MVLRLVRGVGWVLISAGIVVLLYIVYSLFFTNVTTSRAQAELSEQWEIDVDDVEGRVDPEAEPDGDADTEAEAQPVADVEPGSALAVLQFQRPGSAKAPVHADPLYVVEGVSVGDLQRGPGHYPGTALPGQDGNFAIAGHRTTYGAPFFNLDDVEPGDRIFVTDRRGKRYTYVVRKQRIVAPSDTWVINRDPLGTDNPTLTLTTCHPRFSNRQRLVVFAEMAA